ncbi:MAG: hypothetical protein ACOCXM_07345 [Myxococcota bacterium]
MVPKTCLRGQIFSRRHTVALDEEHAAWLLAKDRDLTQVIKSGLAKVPALPVG